MRRHIALLLCSVAGVVSMVHCGGDSRPPPGDDDIIDGGLAKSDAAKAEGGNPSGVAITPTEITFGDNGFVDCGTQAGVKTVTLTNGTGDGVPFKAKLTAGGNNYVVSPDTGTVLGGGSATIQITPNPIPQASEVTPDLYAGTLEITTIESLPPTVIRLHQTARGAIITSTIGGAELDFGAVKVNTTATKQFSITNSGNVNVTANFAVGGAPFAVDPSVALGPNETANPNVKFTPTDIPATSTTLVLTVTGNAARCAPLPGTAAIKGSGSQNVDVTPASLNFGDVDCGNTAPFQLLTIHNDGQAMQVTPSLGKQGGSPFSLAADSDGSPLTLGSPFSVAANSTYVMRVVPKTVPNDIAVGSIGPNQYGDTLTITTNSAGDNPHIIQLNQTARGAYLTMEPATLNISTAPGIFTNQIFTLKNLGSVASPFTLDLQSTAPDGTFSFSLPANSVPAGGSLAPQLTIKMPPPPDGGTQWPAKITLNAQGTPLCSTAHPIMNILLTPNNGP